MRLKKYGKRLKFSPLFRSGFIEIKRTISLKDIDQSSEEQ